MSKLQRAWQHKVIVGGGNKGGDQSAAYRHAGRNQHRKAVQAVFFVGRHFASFAEDDGHRQHHGHDLHAAADTELTNSVLKTKARSTSAALTDPTLGTKFKAHANVPNSVAMGTPIMCRKNQVQKPVSRETANLSVMYALN